MCLNQIFYVLKPNFLSAETKFFMCLSQIFVCLNQIFYVPKPNFLCA